MRTFLLVLVLSLAALVAVIAVKGCGSEWAEFESIPGMVDAQDLVPGLLVGRDRPNPVLALGQDLRPREARCYLQEDAALMLARAGRHLKDLRPDLRLLAVDCSRTLEKQRQMWAASRGTKRAKIVAHPDRGHGSLHTLGCAIDLTLADRKGKSLDLGGEIEGDLSQPQNEFKAYAGGALKAEHWYNRLLLRLVMVRAGWRPVHNEWWHFNCATPQEAWQRYPRIP
jgi:D-alanyl-D-alanine dipeptidase